MTKGQFIVTVFIITYLLVNFFAPKKSEVQVRYLPCADGRGTYPAAADEPVGPCVEKKR